MTFITEFTSITVIFALAIISPGPDFIIVSRQSLRYGKKAGILTALGIGTGNLIAILYTLFGLGVLIIQYKFIFNIIKFGGAGYLIYLGFNALKSKGINFISFQDQEKDNRKNKKNSFLVGFWTTLLNPKAVLFIVSVFTLVVSPNTSFFNKAIYGIWEVFLVVIWFILVATLLTTNNIRIFFIKYSKYIDKIFGIILILFAMTIIVFN
jgi:RhtB (resistance to homoserine/threonine) family protein